jgi:hypothetical protein
MKRILIAAMLVAATGGALAQDTSVRMLMQPGAQAQAQAMANQARVTVSYNLYVPGPVGLSDAGIAAQEHARRSMYTLAAKECEVLRETIAVECRLETINVNVNRHQGQQQPEGFSIGANVGYRVTLK